MPSHRSSRVVLLICLVAGSLTLIHSEAALGVQPTMGFTRPFVFPPSPGTNLHWIAIPWSYHPADTGTLGLLDAEDLCSDLGGSETVASVSRWNEATATLVEHMCGAGSPFALVMGTGYAIRNTFERTIAGTVAGAHDNAFSYSIVASGGSQVSWLSIPYHLRMPEKFGDLIVTAEDLCQQIGGAEMFAVTRWNNELSVYESYGCGSTLATPFEISRGESYAVVNRGTQTIVWQPIHY